MAANGSVAGDGSVASADAPSRPPQRVLTLGDGNFSFSLAYLRKHGSSIHLVASSYDSYEELIAKYPESVRICAQLRELGATVLHRVDATNLRVSLSNARSNDDDNSRAEIDSHFDRIIFNHPHCGEENLQRHQSFLSHFFASAKPLLRDTAARVQLTLAEGQPERWQTHERAAKAGLSIVDEVHDVDAHAEYAVEYERKRHQNGKSFHRVLLHGERKEQSSTLFVFALPGVAEEGAIPSRKRKLDTEVASSTAGTSPEAFACEPCTKSFKTAQGLKTHMHMVHKLGVGGGASKQSVACEHCDRTFKNEDALRQHNISKHGSDSSIQPDWFTRSRPTCTEATENSERGGDSGEPQTCEVCGFTFMDTDAFRAHWEELRPKTVVHRECSLCGRSFEEERALRQHVNYCRVKSEQVSSQEVETR